MPILVHLAPEKVSRAIRRDGIRPVTAGRGTLEGVFCLPARPDFLATHQWSRELKRRGQRTLVAVDFRLHSDEPAWFGHYGRPLAETTVGGAVALFMRLADTRGYELVVPRKVRSDEIVRVRPLRRAIGWRYWPDAHGTTPCPCRVCLPKGTIGSARLRRRLDPSGDLY